MITQFLIQGPNTDYMDMVASRNYIVDALLEPTTWIVLIGFIIIEFIFFLVYSKRFFKETSVILSLLSVGIANVITWLGYLILFHYTMFTHWYGLVGGQHITFLFKCSTLLAFILIEGLVYYLFFKKQTTVRHAFFVSTFVNSVSFFLFTFGRVLFILMLASIFN